MSDFKYEIERKLAVLSETKAGWTKEVNMVSWNGRPAKLDIREWNHEENKMSKGLTFNEEEVEKLKEVLSNF